MTSEIFQRVQEHFKDCPKKEYQKGDTIFSANEEPGVISFIEEGIIEEIDLTPEGTEIIVNIFKPGTFFPMSWAMNKTPNRYFYVAHTKAVVRQEPPEKTIAFIKDNPDILYNLLQRVFRGTDGIIRRLVLGVSSASKKRLVYELLLEAHRFGEDIGEGQKRIAIRQNELAARTGLARETVSRELKNLEDCGYILRYKQGIVVNTSRVEHALDYADNA